MLQARASASSQGHSLTCLELLQVSFPAAHDFLSTLRDRHRDPQSNVFLHDLMDPQETEPDRSKHVKIGKFARRVSKKYQAYMRQLRSTGMSLLRSHAAISVQRSARRGDPAGDTITSDATA